MNFILDYFFTIFIKSGNNKPTLKFINHFSIFLIVNCSSILLLILNFIFVETELNELATMSFIIVLISMALKLFFIGFKRNEKVENYSTFKIIFVFILSMGSIPMILISSIYFCLWWKNFLGIEI
jgi:small-conductance mechanosensitive channel